MIITEDMHLECETDFIKVWQNKAYELIMETGIWITIKTEYKKEMYFGNIPWRRLTRICFVIKGHEFETLPELIRALKLQVFL
jgi:hypothetical protein